VIAALPAPCACGLARCMSVPAGLHADQQADAHCNRQHHQRTMFDFVSEPPNRIIAHPRRFVAEARGLAADRPAQNAWVVDPWRPVLAARPPFTFGRQLGRLSISAWRGCRSRRRRATACLSSFAIAALIAAFLNDAPRLIVHRTPSHAVFVFNDHSGQASPMRIYSPPMPANDVLPVFATRMGTGVGQLDDDEASIARGARHRLITVVGCRHLVGRVGDPARK
jgi:hypothetical protein